MCYALLIGRASLFPTHSIPPLSLSILSLFLSFYSVTHSLIIQPTSCLSRYFSLSLSFFCSLIAISSVHLARIRELLSCLHTLRARYAPHRPLAMHVPWCSYLCHERPKKWIDKHTTKQSFENPPTFSLLVLALFLHHHFRLTQSSWSQGDKNKTG